jgi:hypothetical protein
MNQIGERAVSTYTIKTNEYVNNFISDKSITDFNGPKLASMHPFFSTYLSVDLSTSALLPQSSNIP